MPASMIDIKQEEQMLEKSIIAIIKGLLWSHLSYINPPSRTLGLVHATLQQNDCKSSSFPVTLWPWLKFKVIQTGIILVDFSCV